MYAFKFLLLMVGTFVAIVAIGWAILAFWWVFALMLAFVIAKELM